jgi:excisionase family DNA binding protein
LETTFTPEVGMQGSERNIGQRALLDIEEVASLLGVGVRHVRRLVADRRIPYLKWGHLLRFDPVEVERWLDEAGGRRRGPRSSACRRFESGGLAASRVGGARGRRPVPAEPVLSGGHHGRRILSGRWAGHGAPAEGRERALGGAVPGA